MSDSTDDWDCFISPGGSVNWVKLPDDHPLVVARNRIAVLSEAIATHERHLRGQGYSPRAFDLDLWNTLKEQT